MFVFAEMMCRRAAGRRCAPRRQGVRRPCILDELSPPLLARKPAERRLQGGRDVGR